MSLVHVHICRACGHPQHREEIDIKAIASGIIDCRECGASGPLNLQIIDSDKAQGLDLRKGPRSTR